MGSVFLHGTMTNVNLRGSLLLAVLGLAACVEDEPPSITTSVRRLDGWEQTSSLGFSVRDAFPVAEGRCRVVWNEAPEGVSYSASPAVGAGPSPLPTTIAKWTLRFPAEGSPEFRVEEHLVECDPSRVITNGRGCDDRISFFAYMSFVSDDGVLAETDLPVRGEIYSPAEAAIVTDTDLSPTELGGTLSVTTRFGTPELAFTAQIDRGQLVVASGLLKVVTKPADDGDPSEAGIGAQMLRCEPVSEGG